MFLKMVDGFIDFFNCFVKTLTCNPIIAPELFFELIHFVFKVGYIDVLVLDHGKAFFALNQHFYVVANIAIYCYLFRSIWATNRKFKQTPVVDASSRRCANGIGIAYTLL